MAQFQKILPRQVAFKDAVLDPGPIILEDLEEFAAPPVVLNIIRHDGVHTRSRDQQRCASLVLSVILQSPVNFSSLQGDRSLRSKYFESWSSSARRLHNSLRKLSGAIAPAVHAESVF